MTTKKRDGTTPGAECLHEEIERLGVRWTHCTQCGKKWADDEGGPPKLAPSAAVEPKPATRRYRDYPSAANCTAPSKYEQIFIDRGMTPPAPAQAAPADAVGECSAHEILDCATCAAAVPEGLTDEPIAEAYRNGLPQFGYATVITKLPGANKLPIGRFVLYARPASDDAKAADRPPRYWVHIDRSYDQRAKAITAFNTCTGDLDDKIDAAWRAAIAASKGKS